MPDTPRTAGVRPSPAWQSIFKAEGDGFFHGPALARVAKQPQKCRAFSWGTVLGFRRQKIRLPLPVSSAIKRQKASLNMAGFLPFRVFPIFSAYAAGGV
jgi:hypothetical protein